MRLYEFGNLDTETQKFLICIFEVGEWYVDNVYTYQGGLQTVIETENIAKASASDMAYNRWQNYRDTEYYNKKYNLEDTKRILPVVYDSENNPTTLVTYRCDLFKNANYGYGDNKYSKSGRQKLKNAEGELIDEEWKNYCVIDDCSKFAAAVYYHYINKEILKNEYMADKTAYDIDLWGTSSEMFSDINVFTKKLLNTRKFLMVTWNLLEKHQRNNIVELFFKGEKFNLQPGDLLYRKGHVEFYIGNNRVVSWGRVHSTYQLFKKFEPSINGYYSTDPLDNNTLYTSIIRVKKGVNINYE